jgi:hypothetical protein
MAGRRARRAARDAVGAPVTPLGAPAAPGTAAADGDGGSTRRSFPHHKPPRRAGASRFSARGARQRDAVARVVGWRRWRGSGASRFSAGRAWRRRQPGGGRCLPLALIGLLAGVAPALVAPPPARAHELGAFQVYGSFQLDGSFRLDIKVDDEHLRPAELGGPAHVTRYGRIAGLAGPTERRFGRFLSDLADSMTLAFDGAAVVPTLSMDPGAAASSGGGSGAGGGAPTRATMRVEGWIPGGARAFTFKSTLQIKAYPLVLTCEGDESSTWRWVPGGQVSPPYALAARVVPQAPAIVARRAFERGFAGILPHGPTVLLLVAAMFLLARSIPAALVQLAAFALGQGLGLALALRGSVPLRPALVEPLLALALACLAAVCLAAPRPWPWGGPWPRLAAWLPAGLLAAVLASGALCGVELARSFLPAAPAPADSPAAGNPTTSSPAADAPASAAAILPPPQLPAVLEGLGLGATAAELAVMAAAFLLIGLPFRRQPWYRGRVVVPASCLIAVVGLYWSLFGLLS